MADIPRLNGVIRALEAGKPAFTCFSPAEIDSARSRCQRPEIRRRRVRDGAQSLGHPRAARQRCNTCSTARQIVQGRLARARGDADGAHSRRTASRKAQWHAKQALDIGVYGIVWPHISTVEEAYNAVAACRYPRLKTAPNYEPAGIRGDGPTGAVRYWGLTPAGILRPRRRVAARSERRDFRHPADGGHARHREPRRDAQRRCRASARF